MEMRCFRKLPYISYKDHITDKEVKTRNENVIGLYEDLLTLVKRCKLRWYDHTIIWAGQDCPTLNSTRREMKRQTEKTTGRQH